MHGTRLLRPLRRMHLRTSALRRHSNPRHVAAHRVQPLPSASPWCSWLASGWAWACFTLDCNSCSRRATSAVCWVLPQQIYNVNAPQRGRVQRVRNEWAPPGSSWSGITTVLLQTRAYSSASGRPPTGLGFTYSVMPLPLPVTPTLAVRPSPVLKMDSFLRPARQCRWFGHFAYVMTTHPARMSTLLRRLRRRLRAKSNARLPVK